jgi:hypothetical protein
VLVNTLAPHSKTTKEELAELEEYIFERNEIEIQKFLGDSLDRYYQNSKKAVNKDLSNPEVHYNFINGYFKIYNKIKNNTLKEIALEKFLKDYHKLITSKNKDLSQIANFGLSVSYARLHYMDSAKHYLARTFREFEFQNLEIGKMFYFDYEFEIAQKFLEKELEIGEKAWNKPIAF